MNTLAYLQQQDPSVIEPYTAVQGNPSYGSDVPQDYPYDPGATSSLYELGYIPATSSLLSLVFIGVFSLVIFFFVFRQSQKHKVLRILILLSIAFVFLGPLSIASISSHTTIGYAKIIGLFLIALTVVKMVRTKSIDIVHTASFIPICLYIISLLISGFTMTNTYFFVKDISLIIGGLMFFYIAYSYIEEESLQKDVVTLLSYATLFPSAIVLFINFFQQQGVALISGLYPRYENIVFNFDLKRGRILSIIDLEFFVPFVLYMLITERNKLMPIIKITLLSFSVYLTMYRYRFLTFVVGTFAYLSSIFSLVSKKMIAYAAGFFILLFGVYMIIAVSLGKTTIIDRFLLEDKKADYDSIRRRFVMIGQAWELFTEYPIFGVGVGNYKDNVQVTYTTFGGRTYEPYYKVLQNVYAYPHNWFMQVLAENGIVGFIVLMYLLYTFGRIDLRLMQKLKGNRKLLFLAFSVSSWLYVFANQFTPLNNSQPMVIFFWLFRGIIERTYQQTTFSLPISRKRT
ncbi:MAG: O-antigen ligase family protein [Microgenomates group bacterium]